MTDERKNIDELFSQELGEFSPAPPPELWERIEAALPVPASEPVMPGLGSGRVALIGIAAAIIAGLLLVWLLKEDTISPPAGDKPVNQHEIAKPENIPASKAAFAEPTRKAKTSNSPDKQAEQGIFQPATANVSENLLRENPVKAGAATTSEKSNSATSEFSYSLPADAFPGVKDKKNSPESMSALRLDFKSWLSSLPTGLNAGVATNEFDYLYRESRKPALPKPERIPLIGGAYAAWDLIDYGTGDRKQSQTFGLSLSTFKGAWLIETGTAINLSEDNGRFMINYNSYDSIGYYNKVVSFSPDPQNPGAVRFNTIVEGVYDSIDHSLETSTASRYTYLQIPLTIGYHLYSNRLLTLSFRAGPVFSLLLDSNEPTASYDQQGTSLTSIEDLSPARVSTNWQLSASLGFGFHLSQRFTLLAEPTYKAYLRSVYQNNHSKPQSIGLKAGLLYRF